MKLGGLDEKKWKQLEVHGRLVKFIGGQRPNERMMIWRSQA